MLYAVTAFFLFIVPLFVNRGIGDGIRVPKEYLSVLGFVAIIFTTVYYYRLRPFKHKWLLFFGGWCFFLAFANHYFIPVYLEKVLLDTPSLMLAWKELLYITLSITTIYCLASFTPRQFNFDRKNVSIRIDEFDIKRFTYLTAKVVSIIVIILSIYSIIQAIGLDEFFRVCELSTGYTSKHPLLGSEHLTGSVSHRTVATVGNPTVLGIFLAMCSPLCLYLKSKFGYTAFGCGIISIIFTSSAMAFIGAVVGILGYLFFENRKIAIILLSILILLSIGFYSTKKFRTFINPTGRIEVHKEAWSILKEKSLTGLGLGTFEYLIGGNPEIVKKLNNNSWRELHNDIGQVWWSTGLVGLGLFLMFILSTIRKFLRCITDEGVALFASLSAFLVMSLGFFTMRVAPISFYGVILTGLLLNTIGEK